jgi:tyrosinase
MEPLQRQVYEGHRIELRPRAAARAELLIDDVPVGYGQLSDGLYFLNDYAYDWREDLLDLARAFIDYRSRADAMRRLAVSPRGQRVRKNYRSLTKVERERFVAALKHVKSNGTVGEFADLHEVHFDHGLHGGSHFLPWHREMLRRFERALQQHHPDVTIPYWDSTVDDSPSDPLWDNSFLGQFDSAWDLNRALGSDVLPTLQQVQANQGRTTYGSFWPQLENVIHNPPHRWVGGVMSGRASPGDPVFYLHHCWIDLLWAQWQVAHPDAPFEASGPGQDLDDPLAVWLDRTPANVLNHHRLCYRYDLPFEVLSVRRVFRCKDLDPADGVRAPMTAAGTSRLRRFLAD